jgi:murein DD-endopeptidase MepM/ murein hydrolase activator NlpD
VTIGRSEKKRDGIDPAGMDRWAENYNVWPEDAAQIYYDAYSHIWLANPHIDIWITFNEWSNHWAWQSSFNIAMAELTKAKGHPWRWGFMGWSSGNPPGITEGDFSVVREVLPCLWYAKQHGHVLCTHEYSGELGYHPGRYKTLYKFLKNPYREDGMALRPADCDLFITESGFVTYPGEETLMREVRMLDDLYAGDDFLKGSALFTLGRWTLGGAPDAPDANIQAAVPEPLAEHIVTFQPDPPPDKPDPESPIKDRGAPRYDYRATRWVLDPSLKPNQIDAILELWKRERVTLTFSFDEGSIGDLSERFVVLWHDMLSEEKRDEYDGWHDDNYPGVDLQFEQAPGGETEPPPSNYPEFWLASPVPSITFHITDPFNTPRPYANGKHEGVDIRSWDFETQSRVEICAAQTGIVLRIRIDDTPVRDYGNYVDIQHDGPWKDGKTYVTRYAHLDSIYTDRLKLGQYVDIGLPLGIGGKTDTDAIHLHLTLQRFNQDGSDAGLSGYIVRSVVDPEPHFVVDPEPPPEETHVPVAMLHLAAPGLHPNDPNGSFLDDIGMLQDAKMDGFIFTSNSDTDPDSLGILLQNTSIDPHNVIIRIHKSGTDDFIADPAKYVEHARPWIDHGLSRGVRKFQLWNEPNLDQSMVDAGRISRDQMEWPHDARTFSDVFADVANRLFGEYDTSIKIGYPPMSPQDNADDYYEPFMGNAMAWADWFAIHSYFSTDGSGLYGIDSQTGGLYWQRVLDWIPADVPVWITEFADNGNDTDANRARRTAAYYTKKYPLRIKGLACYISQDGNFPKQAWNKNPHMVAAVRDR